MSEPTTLEMTTEEEILDTPDSAAEVETGADLEGVEETEEEFQAQCDASYCPDDNKIRLQLAGYPRLDRELWSKLREGAGFKWDYINEQLVAPWTPGREDWAIKLAGFVGDHDTTLVERAEERYNRFGGYRARKIEAAGQIAAKVGESADLSSGNAVLVAHHTFSRAASRARRLEGRMHKALELWETADYWQRRAEGALRHAQHKESAPVRYRRIREIESELKKHLAGIEELQRKRAAWSRDPLTLEWAKSVANYSHITVYYTKDKYPNSQYEGANSLWSGLDRGLIDQHEAAAIAIPACERGITYHQRWADHYNRRLTYERAMLGEAGGLAAERFDLQPGGKVLYRGSWQIITRINRKDGRIISVSVPGRYRGAVANYEDIKDYQPPTEETAKAVKAVTKLAPIVNFPGEGFLHMTKAEYDKTVPKWSDFSKIGRVAATETTGAYRVRKTRKPGGEYYHTVGVYLTDVKRVDPPKLGAPTEVAAEPMPTPRRVAKTKPEVKPELTPMPEAPAGLAQAMATIQETVRAGGVQVEEVPQLFATPEPVAARVAQVADIQPGDEILEPSVGTCRLLEAFPHGKAGRVVGVEINRTLAEMARKKFPQAEIVTGDFLQQNGNLGKFDVILANPPFTHGSDIRHIQHMTSFLKPGGRVVAICLDNDKRRDILRPLAEQSGGSYEALPESSFKQEGTYVPTAIVKIYANTA